MSNIWGYFTHLFVTKYVKGTVRQDWICIRAVPVDRPWKGHPFYFQFWISCKVVYTYDGRFPKMNEQLYIFSYRSKPILIYGIAPYPFEMPNKWGNFPPSFCFQMCYVRPDCICMRGVPLNRPWKGHQPPYRCLIFHFSFEFWKDFKVLSRFLQKWIRPPACSDHGLYRIPFFLLTGALLFVEKIRQRAALFWFRFGMLEFFKYSTHDP